MAVVRPEQPGDVAAIHAVHAASFPTDAEARLVGLLRAAGHLPVSLVAEAGGAVVGHVAFGPVSAATGAGGAGLAPRPGLGAHPPPGLAARPVAARLPPATPGRARRGGAPGGSGGGGVGRARGAGPRRGRVGILGGSERPRRRRGPPRAAPARGAVPGPPAGVLPPAAPGAPRGGGRPTAMRLSRASAYA